MTELEELVGFLAHPNPQIREVAIENLVPYSTAQPSIFKMEQLLPVKHLKALVRDRNPKLAEHSLTILVNLTGDEAVLHNVATDDNFCSIILSQQTSPSAVNADLISMLLANLAKHDGFKDVLGRKQPSPAKLVSDDLVMNQLLDLFVKGSDGSYNNSANFDYLAYFFADMAKHAEVRQYFATRQAYDNVIPLSKVRVFTDHPSNVRRKGVASTIKNVAFDVSSHPAFFSEDENILSYVLLPIMGNEQYDLDDSMAMLPDLQLLPPTKQRDPDSHIVQTHIETLTLLTATRKSREMLRQLKIYPIIRETHLRVDDEGVREACERLVQVLARDEAEAGNEALDQTDVDDDGNEDEDDRIVEMAMERHKSSEPTVARLHAGQESKAEIH